MVNNSTVKISYWKKIFGDKFNAKNFSRKKTTTAKLSKSELNSVASDSKYIPQEIIVARDLSSLLAQADLKTKPALVARIFLFTECNSKNNTLVSEIANELQLSCYLFGSLPETAVHKQLSANDLLLIDYRRYGFDKVAFLISIFSEQSSSLKVALFNIDKLDNIEPLLKWPIVKGIFPNINNTSLFIEGINEILTSNYWLPRALMHKMIDQFRRMTVKKLTQVKLTKKEIQLLKKLSEGETNQFIAQSLNVSEHTIKSHLYNIFKKIEVKNRLQASNWAKEHLTFELKNEKV